MDAFMKRAVELSLNNVKEGGRPFGAVLVKDNEVISEGVNELHKVHDISGHAELLAIRRAQEKLETTDLSGFTMYASGEPCPMCLSAMYFSGIDEVYFSQTIEETTSYGLKYSDTVYNELEKEWFERTMTSHHIPLEEGQNNPMKLWKEKNQ